MSVTKKKNWKTVEIEQQCQYGWTMDKVKEFVDWVSIKDYAYILHDKCTKTDGSIKESHIHCMIRFKDSEPQTAILSRAEKICGKGCIKEEQLQKCWKWTSAIAYLTHENKPQKVQYSRSEVVSNYDFEADIDSEIQGKIRLLQIVKGITDGIIKEYNITQYCTAEEYVMNKQKIDNAFAFRTKILMQESDRDMKCIYIQGESGSGKTSYAKAWCVEKNLSYFVSSGSNDVLDGYGGQEAIILDDLRPSAMSLADLLKMLDNNTASSVKSRYRNKVLECKYIIITTVLDIERFFSSVFMEQPETATQLRRRCTSLIKMTKKEMKIGMYEPYTDEYIYTSAIPNPIANKYDLNREKKIDELRESIKEMFGTLQGIDEAMKDIGKNDFEEADQEKLLFM